MGKADVNVNIWLSEKNRFANLFNGVIYGGENVILPEDLQVILTMLKYRKDKDGLRNYVNENKKFFQKVDHETSQAMKAFLNMKQIPGETENEEEIINMCEAIQEMYDDGVRDGMKRGIQQGIQQGRDDLLKDKVKRKLQKQKSLEQIADELEEDVKVIRKIIKEVQ